MVCPMWLQAATSRLIALPWKGTPPKPSVDSSLRKCGRTMTQADFVCMIVQFCSVDLFWRKVCASREAFHFHVDATTDRSTLMLWQMSLRGLRIVSISLSLSRRPGSDRLE